MSCSSRQESIATAHFLSAVITDDFQNCGNHPDSLQTWLMPDIIGDDSIKADDSMYGKSAWCTIEIPQNIKAGSYKLNLLLQQDGKTVSTIPFIIKVLNRKLTLSDNFHLNFWQQPYAVSRYYTRVRDKKRLVKVGNLVKNSYLYR